jgi:hypothetical protein
MYWVPPARSNSSPIHAGFSARCSANLVMTVTRLCSTQRSTTASMTMAHRLKPLDAGPIAWCRTMKSGYEITFKAVRLTSLSEFI